jgi:hypothetical protein
MKIEFPKENRGAVIQTEINQRMPRSRESGFKTAGE